MFVECQVHRIGRTGRAGRTGTAVTFFNVKDDMKNANLFIKLLEDAKQTVPPQLMACKGARGKPGRSGGGWRGGWGGGGRGRGRGGGGRGRGGRR